MSKEVKRYNFDVDKFGSPRAYESEHGRWVKRDDYKALLAELDALKKDAERYRWLRNRALQVSFSAPAIMMVNDSCEPVSNHAWRSALSGNDADAAIDAALQGEQPCT